MGEFKIICFLCSAMMLLYSSSSSPHLCHPHDSLSLLHFKKEMFSLNHEYYSFCDDHGQYSICEYSYPKMMMWNNTSSDCCKWDGVACNKITSHVIGLDLSSSKLKGVIHQNSTLFHLSHLVYLNLAYNDFRDLKISTNIGALSSLTHLNFSHTYFEGTVPPELSYLSKLVLLDLSYNGFNDKLRFNLGDFRVLLRNLTRIRVLSLFDVQIPTTSQANWSSSSLTYLDLGYTGVKFDKLSDSISHLPLLQTLILVGNENLSIGLQKSTCIFDGIPDFICSFASLKHLEISWCGLSGSYTNYIGNLSQIVELYLNHNSFTGKFPTYIRNLTELTTLHLGSNFLRGPLPSNLIGFQKIRELYLLENKFNVSIPSWIFSLPSLTVLYLSENSFTGQISEFLSLTSLQVVDLSGNQLNGPIPDSIFQLVNLSILELHSNNLSGSIDFTLFSNLKHLRVLSLSHNKLSLKIENKINISFPGLFQLGLSSCGITEFPDFLNSSNLWYLDLSNNKLNGQIPNWINGHSLQYLNLSRNSLSSLGPLNINLTLMKNLYLLDLGSNQFQESLPLSICSLEHIYILDLSHNNFSGSIPECFANLRSILIVMNLAKNDLKGSLSMKFPNNCQLVNLNLNGNSLEGPLPRSLANCKYLEALDVGNNKINDTFPTFLKDLVELKVLIFKSNRFSGRIRNFRNENFLPNLLIFDLSCNEFSGALPPKLFKNFKAMAALGKIEPNGSYMGTYYSIGPTESYLWTIDSYQYSMTFVMKGNILDLIEVSTSFIVIDLSSNNFIGKIPETIGDLNLLIALNLSRNNFSGHIPSKFGSLHFFESLDLSWNQIDREIPRELTDITNLEFLNVFKNHLQGRIPQGKQFNTFLNDSYFGNSRLCGFPVTKDCGGTYQPWPPSQGSNQDDEESSFWSAFTWKSVLIGYGFGFAVGCLVLVTRKPKWLVRSIEEICLNALLLLGKKEICKQFMKKSRRANMKY